MTAGNTVAAPVTAVRVRVVRRLEVEVELSVERLLDAARHAGIDAAAYDLSVPDDVCELADDVYQLDDELQLATERARGEQYDSEVTFTAVLGPAEDGV